MTTKLWTCPECKASGTPGFHFTNCPQMTRSFPRKARLVNSRYVLKRVAYLSLKDGGGPGVPWVDLIDLAAGQLTDTREQATYVANRTWALFKRIRDEHYPPGPNDEELLFTILVEGN